MFFSTRAQGASLSHVTHSCFYCRWCLRRSSVRWALLLGKGCEFRDYHCSLCLCFVLPVASSESLGTAFPPWEAWYYLLARTTG